MIYFFAICVIHTTRAEKNPIPLIYHDKSRQMAVNPVFIRNDCYTYRS